MGNLRRNLFQCRFHREIRRHVLNVWQRTQPLLGRALSREGQSGIFRVEPTEQSSAFFGTGSNHTDACWRREQRDCWRIDNLKNVEAESMRGQREPEKRGERKLAAPSRLPTEKKCFSRGLRGRDIHRGGAAANATDVIPCSSTAFVTSMTVW